MKYILVVIVFCLLVCGCSKEIGIVYLSDKDGCFAVLKLKRESQHLIVLETCLYKTEIDLPGNQPVIKISELFKGTLGTTTPEIVK